MICSFWRSVMAKTLAGDITFFILCACTLNATGERFAQISLSFTAHLFNFLWPYCVAHCSHFESSMFIRPTEWERNGKHAPQRVAINMAFMYFHQELNNLEKWNDRYFEIGTAQIKSGEQLHADTFHSRSIYFCTIALSAETTWKWTQVQFQPPVKTMRP